MLPVRRAMLGKSLLLLFFCMFAQPFCSQMANAIGKDKGELSAKEVKKLVESFGVGITAHIELRLRNGVHMEGFIDRAGDSHFYLVRTDEEIGAADIVAYSDVAEIKGQPSTIDWRNIAIRTGLGSKTMIALIRLASNSETSTETVPLRHWK